MILYYTPLNNTYLTSNNNRNREYRFDWDWKGITLCAIFVYFHNWLRTLLSSIGSSCQWPICTAPWAIWCTSKGSSSEPCTLTQKKFVEQIGEKSIHCCLFTHVNAIPPKTLCPPNHSTKYSSQSSPFMSTMNFVSESEILVKRFLRITVRNYYPPAINIG